LAIARYASAALYRLVGELRGTAFSPIRQRVARHLLDLAAEHQQGALLIAPVTQRQVAEAVGSTSGQMSASAFDALSNSFCAPIILTPSQSRKRL
jgi:hypothetical protein